MNTVNRRRYEMLVRVRGFCWDHRATFEGTPVGSKKLAALDTAVTELTGHFASASIGRDAARSATASRRHARETLRRSLEAIVRTSRLLDLEEAALAQRFPLVQRVSDRALVANARALAEHAAPLAEAFVAHGLPGTLLQELPAQIAAVEQAIVDQMAGTKTHVGANAAVTAALAAGVSAVAALENIFLNTPGQDAHTVAIWKNARRVGPTRLKEAVPADPQPTPAPKAA
jgi:hypothetical protein